MTEAPAHRRTLASMTPRLCWIHHLAGPKALSDLWFQPDFQVSIPRDQSVGMLPDASVRQMCLSIGCPVPKDQDASGLMGFPGGASGEDPACQCRRQKRCGFDPWVGEIFWRRAWQPTPEFLPGESYGQRSLAGYSIGSTKSWTRLKQLSMHTCMVVLFLVFWETSILFSIVAVPVFTPTSSVWGFPFLHILINIYYLWCFWWQPFWQVCGDISLWLWFAFPWWLVMLNIFSCACWLSAFSLWKNVCSVLIPIFNQLSSDIELFIHVGY